MLPVKKDLTLRQGASFELPIKWETEPLIYKAISGISQAAPCVIDCVGHGIPNGWRVTIVSVKGMTQINAQNTPPNDADYVVATVVDADTVELNSVNSASYKAYTGGGYIQYRTPKDLTGFTARMSVMDKIGGTELIRLDTNGGITIDVATSTVTLRVDADSTALMGWKKGVYDLELVAEDGTVTALLYGSVDVVKEVTV